MIGPRQTARGVGMIEVLVALVIIAVGLLGLASAQLQAQKTELESYQRAQALILMQDIASRIRGNREAARCYETTGYIGQGDEPATCSGWGTSATRDLADSDLQEWDGLLEGSAVSRDSNDVGAMTGARGCVTYNTTADNYTVTVAWQGEVATEEPANSCASGVHYGGEGFRRIVSTVVSIPELD